MHHEIRVMTLGLLIGSWTVNEIGSKISENRDLLCAKPAGERRSLSQVVLVGRQDHDRWCGATEELVAKIHALQEKETAASLHRNPPFHDRLLWRVRHAARNWVLRSNYDAAVAELRAEFNAALSAYLERAGDLPSYLEERKRRELERRRRQVEEDKRERAEAMARAKGPVWAYWLSERNSFWIYLADLDHHGEGARTGLTAEQVQEVLAAKRAEQPYMGVFWGTRTEAALQEAHGTAVSGWRALTGEVINPHPRDPTQRRTTSKYHFGPSSNYGSDGGAGGGFDGGGFGGY